MRQLVEDATMATLDTRSHSVTAPSAVARAEALDWQLIRRDLDEQGSAILSDVLSAKECRALASLYPDDGLFRSRVVMARHGFGRGEYKYFSYPLPHLIEGLRTALYRRLAPVANQWNLAMGMDVRYPDAHADFVQRCHDAGQRRPTPLLLQYETGDYNCLHQDLYGEHVFPIQVAFLLSEPGANNVLACNRGRKWCRYAREMESPSPCIIARCRGRADPTG